MDYLEFELQLEKDSEDVYRVGVRSPNGEQRGSMRLSLGSPDLQAFLRQLKNARSGARTRTARDVYRVDPPESPENLKQAASSLGKQLFQALLDPEVRARFRSGLDTARKEQKGLRLRLRIEAPELAVLPWEFLFDDAQGDYLCLNIATPVVRYLAIPLPAEALTIPPPLRILGMVASPEDLPQLDVEKERSQMTEAIRPLIDAGNATLTWVAGETWRDLQSKILEQQWNVFHFIGHGGFHDDEGLIALTGEEDRKQYPLTATALGRLLGGHPSMRLAVLNCCESARASETDLFSSSGTVLVRKGFPAVVSMQYEISDRAALEFSRTFYDSITQGEPVDVAVTKARQAISLYARGDTLEWGTPVLHMRAQDGKLFSFDVRSMIFQDRVKSTQPAESKPRIQDAPAPPKPGGHVAQRGLDILAKKVKRFWIEGVLTDALRQCTLLELGMDSVPAFVDTPWDSLPLLPAQKIAGIFDDFGSSLLILGIPGAGKTTMMLTLARDLLERAETNPASPVPVVFNLSSWRESVADFGLWLANELSGKYQIPRRAGEEWLKSNRLILLLDGLDEVDALRRAACVTSINSFTQQTGLAGVVVCCRFNEYVDLSVRLALNGALRLRDLSREQALSFVENAGQPLIGLHALLAHNSAMLMLAKTPFNLNLMIRTYSDLPAEELLNEDPGTFEQRKRQLMSDYVARQFRDAAAARLA